MSNMFENMTKEEIQVLLDDLFIKQLNKNGACVELPATMTPAVVKKSIRETNELLRTMAAGGKLGGSNMFDLRPNMTEKELKQLFNAIDKEIKATRTKWNKLVTSHEQPEHYSWSYRWKNGGLMVHDMYKVEWWLVRLRARHTIICARVKGAAFVANNDEQRQTWLEAEDLDAIAIHLFNERDAMITENMERDMIEAAQKQGVIMPNCETIQ